MQSDLVRTQKADESNYLLYTRKKEEARIADAMDRTRLLNVSVVQNPALPSIPTRSAFIFVLVAVLLATAVSIGVAFAIDYADQSFRTPSEVMSELRIPVLAAVPVHANGLLGAYAGNGNGNGNHNGNGNGNGNGHAAGVTYDAGSNGATIEGRG